MNSEFRGLVCNLKSKVDGLYDNAASFKGPYARIEHLALLRFEKKYG